MEILTWIGGVAAFFSFFSFIINVILILFSSKNREFYIKNLIYSIIVFIVGFGTCTATLGFLK